MPPVTITRQQMDRVLDWLYSGPSNTIGHASKIQAIKEMRQWTNLGLKEAKDVVDAIGHMPRREDATQAIIGELHNRSIHVVTGSPDDVPDEYKSDRMLLMEAMEAIRDLTAMVEEMSSMVAELADA